MKKKVLLLSALFIILATAIQFVSFSYLLIENKEQYIKAQDIENKDHVKYIVNQLSDFFTNRAYANMNLKGVKKAIKEHNREELYDLIIPRWKTLQKENPFLNVMHFHNADGTTLLRMHNRDFYGDNIAQSRSMATAVHKDKKIISGCELGVSGVAFRILVPIVYRGTYIGALEFGVDPLYIMNELYKLENTNAIIIKDLQQLNKFVSTDKLNKNTFIDNHVYDVFGHLLKSIYKRDGSISLPSELEYENKYYMLNSFRINNYMNEQEMLLVYYNDITHLKNNEHRMSLTVLSISTILLLIVLITQSYFFTTLLKKLDFKQRYSRMLIDSQSSMLAISRDGKNAQDLNKSFLSFLGYEEFEDFKKEHDCICDFFESKTAEGYLQSEYDEKNWIEYIFANPDVEHKAIMKNAAGEMHVFIVHAHKIVDEKNSLLYFVSFADISIVEYEAKIDPLTKLQNRRSFDSVLEYTLQRKARYEESYSILLFDIDHFKKVNDTYGHQRGDEVLVELSELIKDTIRESDIAVRWGGEEFVILLSNTKLEEAKFLAEKIRIIIAQESIANLEITCSFGVVEVTKNDTARSLLLRVDNALYEAKESGRDCVISL